MRGGGPERERNTIKTSRIACWIRGSVDRPLQCFSVAKQPGDTWLAHWLLAADALVLRTSVAEDVVDRAEGKLSAASGQGLLTKIDALEKRTRELFEPIYSPESLEEYMVVHFAKDRLFF